MKPNETDLAEREAVEDATAVEAGVPEGYRRLLWNEPVLDGDFVMDEQRGFELWDGPSGFRADSFVKPIYRRDKKRPIKEVAKS